MSENKTVSDLNGFVGAISALTKLLMEMHASIIETQALATMAVELLNSKVPVEEAKEEEPKVIDLEPAQDELPPEFKEEEPTITIDDLRTKVIQVVNSGKKAEAKAIIAEYAPSVTKVPADKVAEAYKRISALEG